MKKWKVIASAAALFVVIVAAVTLAIMASLRGRARMPDWFLATPIEKIDSESGELITKSVEEWIKLKAPKGEAWKNPETGKYTIVDMIPCVHCREWIPGPLIMVWPAHSREPGYVFKFIREYFSYKCPKCGETAMPPPPGPPGVDPFPPWTGPPGVDPTRGRRP